MGAFRVIFRFPGDPETVAKSVHSEILTYMRKAPYCPVVRGNDYSSKPLQFIFSGGDRWSEAALVELFEALHIPKAYTITIGTWTFELIISHVPPIEAALTAISSEGKLRLFAQWFPIYK